PIPICGSHSITSPEAHPVPQPVGLINLREFTSVAAVFDVAVDFPQPFRFNGSVPDVHFLFYHVSPNHEEPSSVQIARGTFSTLFTGGPLPRAVLTVDVPKPRLISNLLNNIADFKAADLDIRGED